MTCRFCADDAAVAVFDMPGGCVCYPEDRQQALCSHHAFKATPLAGMVLVEDFTVGGAFTKAWSDGT